METNILVAEDKSKSKMKEQLLPETGDSSSVDEHRSQTSGPDRADLSSCSNSNSNGRDSGGGYSGDCSSSDAASASSSDASSKRKNSSQDVHVPIKVSVEKLSLNEQHQHREAKDLNQGVNVKINTDNLFATVKSRRREKKSKDLWQPEDSQHNCNWDVASATQVAIQINALTAIIEQNRRMAEDPLITEGQKNCTLPQWNGIRITHPMDPRIDLRTVGHIPGSNVPVASTACDAANLHANAVLHQDNIHANAVLHQDVPPPSVDNYLNLMEVSACARM